MTMVHCTSTETGAVLHDTVPSGSDSFVAILPETRVPYHVVSVSLFTSGGILVLDSYVKWCLMAK
ncbi:MAG: hypothetical protein ACI9G9_000862 [Psychromonas sp.]|jgi:hypothetical protein